MKDRTGSYTITRDQDCFTINLTTLTISDLHLLYIYIYIYTRRMRNYILRYHQCNKDINYTRKIPRFVLRNIVYHTGETLRAKRRQ